MERQTDHSMENGTVPQRAFPLDQAWVYLLDSSLARETVQESDSSWENPMDRH